MLTAVGAVDVTMAKSPSMVESFSEQSTPLQVNLKICSIVFAVFFDSGGVNYCFPHSLIFLTVTEPLMISGLMNLQNFNISNGSNFILSIQNC